MVIGRKRTKVDVFEIEASETDISELHFDQMVFKCKSDNFYYYRFRYLNVPSKTEIDSGDVILANRDDAVRKTYEALKSVNNTTTRISYSWSLSNYFKYLDEINYTGDPFDNEVIKNSIKHFNACAEKGERVSLPKRIKDAISYLLKTWGRNVDSQNIIPVISNRVKNTIAYHVEKELKIIAKLLVKGAKAFKKAIDSNEFLDLHPFYDEEQFIQVSKSKGWSDKKITFNRMSFKVCMRPINYDNNASLYPHLTKDIATRLTLYNHATRNWFYLFSMLTGMNTSVLSAVRFMDVTFKDIGNGRFVFDGEKARANYKSLDNAMGFSKHTKDLIEGWLITSKNMYHKLGVNIIGSSIIFPYFNMKCKVHELGSSGSNLYSINSRIEKVLGLKVNNLRFRATKADVLMRVTEDIFLVSEGLNNTVNVTSKSYSSGVQADHNNNLNATFSALDAIARGEAIGKAVDNAKVMHSDILSDYDYKKRLRDSQGKPLMTTPTGIKCSGATPEKIVKEARRMKQLGIDFSNDTGRCTDFLGCFECESHKLVASENDIWLMLSFSEQIEELKGFVSGNSSPKDEFFKVEAMLKKVLVRFKERAGKLYRVAQQKVENGHYHPLYQDRSSIKCFFEG